jgi:hypothetical protein
MALTEQFIGPKLYCSRCLSPLIYGPGTKVYETLLEHVCSSSYSLSPKSYYICSNKGCPISSRDFFWDEYGDYYAKGILDEEIFIFGVPEALNSSSRYSRIEQRTKSFTLLNLFWFIVTLESNPIPDEMGINIRGYKRKIVYKLRGKGGSWQIYNPGIKMFFFCINKFRYAKKRSLEEGTSYWHMSQMLECLERQSWDRRWWVLLSAGILNALNPGLKEKLKQCLNTN